jgi:hypothetical protein
MLNLNARDPADPLDLVGCTCAHCNYELKGVTANRCPECGERFTLREVKSRRLVGYSPGVMADGTRRSGAGQAVEVLTMMLMGVAVALGVVLFVQVATRGAGPVSMMMLGLGVGAIFVAAAWRWMT